MKNETQSEITEYPKFIIDKPIGVDEYESQSQVKIAKNVKQFIIDYDKGSNKRRVIGIEGEWGSGKSNVIEILKNELKEEYFFFIFDAWGHQEDLTRRSILEGLLQKLKENSIINGEKEKWEKKLKSLLSKKVEKEYIKIPKLSWAFVLSLIGILLLPVSKYFADIIIQSNIVPATNDTPATYPTFGLYLLSFIVLILPLIPLLFNIIRSLIKAKRSKWSQTISELFYIFKGEEITNTSEETISENEPTVRQFTDFLKEIEDDCPEKKIVVVFDNMDRLPSKKVIEIWSTIHTFFSNDENHLKTWAIVPFDDSHICSIFKKEDSKENENERADSYIHKTFTIVFHVSPPVLSDWKKFFSITFKKAFGVDPPNDQNIETIFDFHNSKNPKIKPRDIICFINDLVALKKFWNDEIPLKYLAVFALKRKEILENPFAKIISKSSLLGNSISLFEFEPKFETYISALTFNVPLSKANEILFKRRIETVFMGNGDFKEICAHSSFFAVFDNVIYSADIQDIVYAIKCIDELPEDVMNKVNMGKYWERISEMLTKKETFDEKYINPIKTLIKRLNNKEHIEYLMKFLFRKAITLNENKEKFYFGSRYYILIDEFEKLLLSKWKIKTISEYLQENNMEADEYFQFIDSAKEKYIDYKVTCNIQNLNKFLIDKFTEDKISEHRSDLILLVRNKTDLSAFISHINGVVQKTNAAIPDYSTIIKNIFNVGVILSTNEKQIFNIPESTATTLLQSMSKHESAIHLILTIIKANIIKPQQAHTQIPVVAQFLSNASITDRFITLYKHYFSYSELINYYLAFPSTLLKSVIIKITTSSEKVDGSEIEKLITKYVDIKEKIFDNEIKTLRQFIFKLDGLYLHREIDFIKDEKALEYVTPLIIDNYIIDCKLINDIVNNANKYLFSLNKEIWSKSFEEHEKSQIFGLFKNLLNSNKYLSTKLSDAANEAYKEYIYSVSKKEKNIPKEIELWNKIFDLHVGNLTLTFKNIRDELLKVTTHGEVTIEELLFFERGLFQYGELCQNKERADEVLRLILIPLVKDDKMYINILKRNPNQIKNIIEATDVLNIDFKNKINTECPSIINDSECGKIVTTLNSKIEIIEKERYENRLIIVSAKYGKKNIYNDVTDIVTQLLNNNGSFIANNDNLGGDDPIENVIKEIDIRYKIKKQSKNLKANEDENIIQNSDGLTNIPTDKSIEKQQWIQNTKTIHNVFIGEWKLKWSKDNKEDYERVWIEENGKYYADEKYKFDLLVTEMNEKTLCIRKINFESKEHANETLSIINEDLISGTDNWKNKLEYKKQIIAVNIDLKDREKLQNAISKNPEMKLLKFSEHNNIKKTDHYTVKVKNGIDLFKRFEDFLKKNKIDYIDYHEL